MLKRKYNIDRIDNPVDGYGYNVQVFMTVDGENFYYCGIGKFCKTEQDAQDYITAYEAAHE